MLFKYVTLVLFLIIAISLVGLFKIDENETPNIKKSVTPSNNLYKPKMITWIPYWDQKVSYERFKQNKDIFDYVSLFWYRLDKSGDIRLYNTTIEDSSIIEYAHQNNTKVLAVIANLPDFEEGGDWDYQRVDAVIQNKQARTGHIERIGELILEKNFDGINIDYENLRRRQRANFSLFIQELSEKLHGMGKIVGVAIHPKTSETNPLETNGSQAQDLAEIAKYVDQMYFMTYDNHNEETEPGAISPIDWMEDVLSYAIDTLGIPKEKVFIGLPLYGYDWTKNSGEGIEFEDAKRLQSLYQESVKWHDDEGESSFSYASSLSHQIWFNDARSIAKKIEKMLEFKPGGFAFWRIGREDPNVWNFVETINN